jgi:hypothetical protein
MSKSFKQISHLESTAKHFLLKLFKSASEQGFSSSEINKKYLEYREQVDINSFPRYVSSYITGIRDVLAAQIESEMEFCYVIGDKRYSIRRESDMYYEKHNLSAKDIYEKSSISGHYWIKTGKPYFKSDHHK